MYMWREKVGARGDRVTGPKVGRAKPISAAFEQGKILLQHGVWNRDFMNELTSFPDGQHDDIVDATSGAFKKLQSLPFRLIR